MNLKIKLGIEHLDWLKVCKVLELAPLGKRDAKRLRSAAEKSYAVCTAYDGEALIGFGRAFS